MNSGDTGRPTSEAQPHQKDPHHLEIPKSIRQTDYHLLADQSLAESYSKQHRWGILYACPGWIFQSSYCCFGTYKSLFLQPSILHANGNCHEDPTPHNL